MKQAAIELAKSGFKVFPCKPNAKTPAYRPTDLEHGCKDATSDLNRISEWWDVWPTANIGIAPTEDLMVLDVDAIGATHKYDGVGNLKKLPPLPTTLTAKTATGGYHYFFKIPSGVKILNNNSGTLEEGIDVKTIGGYVVAAPSINGETGTKYTWVEPKQPIVEAPSWLLAKLKPQVYTHGPIPVNITPSDKCKRAAQYIKNVPGAVQFKGGDEATTNLCRLVGVGFDVTWEEIAGPMLTWNQTCSPPWNDDILRKKFERVRAKTTLQYGYLLVAREPVTVPAPKLPLGFEQYVHSLTDLRERNTVPISTLAQYIMEGGITEIVGAPKLAGKTTFALWMAKAMVNGELFLGCPTTKTNVLMLSEMRDATILDAFEGITDGPLHGFNSIVYNDVLHLTWPERMVGAVAYAKANDTKLIIVDTFSQWADIRGDDENSSGAMMEAMKPILQATSQGISVILIRHSRKAKGDLVTGARGSSALTGTVDITLTISRTKNENERLLKTEGRYANRFPEELRINYIDGTGYFLTGEHPYIKRERDNDLRILKTIKQNLGVPEIITKLKEGSSGIRKASLLESLKRLVKAGKIKEFGKGVSGDPRTYGPVANSNPGLEELEEIVELNPKEIKDIF